VYFVLIIGLACFRCTLNWFLSWPEYISLSWIVDRVQEVFGVMLMLLSSRTMVHQLKLQKSKCSLSLLIGCAVVMNVLVQALRYTFVLFCID
jgi:hypothetical protein